MDILFKILFFFLSDFLFGSEKITQKYGENLCIDNNLFKQKIVNLSNKKQNEENRNAKNGNCPKCLS